VLEAKGEPIGTVACYCDDCQAAAAQIADLPGSRSGLGPDGGTVSTLFRKDLVRCTSGEALLVKHKLRPDSPATRMLASCCNSNMTTQFENWLPMIALRTHSGNVESVNPELCINTKFAPDKAKIVHAAPQYPTIPPRLGLKVAAAAAYLAFVSLGHRHGSTV
jgi:hypothetical protein